jgi:UDP-glucose 6-dehydrogenase
MENAYLALKVSFCNEFYELATRLQVDYEELRELWLLDPRIGRSHTFVFPDKRGFGGRCLPKDLEAVVRIAEDVDYQPALLTEVMRTNERMRLLSVFRSPSGSPAGAAPIPPRKA